MEKKMRDKVLKIWPEINWIQDKELRKNSQLLGLCN
jgi:hypothetical protein